MTGPAGEPPVSRPRPVHPRWLRCNPGGVTSPTRTSRSTSAPHKTPRRGWVNREAAGRCEAGDADGAQDGMSGGGRCACHRPCRPATALLRPARLEHTRRRSSWRAASGAHRLDQARRHRVMPEQGGTSPPGAAPALIPASLSAATRRGRTLSASRCRLQARPHDTAGPRLAGQDGPPQRPRDVTPLRRAARTGRECARPAAERRADHLGCATAQGRIPVPPIPHAATAAGSVARAHRNVGCTDRVCGLFCPARREEYGARGARHVRANAAAFRERSQRVLAVPPSGGDQRQDGATGSRRAHVAG
jgi:hypothetical protein